MKVFLEAKINTYLLNAIHDLEVHDILVGKKKLKDYPIHKKRVDYFRKQARNHSSPTNYLVAVAYIYKFWNGLYDYLYARLLYFLRYFRPLMPSESPIKIGHQSLRSYHNLHKGPIYLVGGLVRLFFGRFCGTSIAISTEEMVATMIEVQRVNIEHNQSVISSASNQKYLIHKQLAEESKNPALYLRTVNQTLEAASFWINSLFVS